MQNIPQENTESSQQDDGLIEFIAPDIEHLTIIKASETSQIERPKIVFSDELIPQFQLGHTDIRIELKHLFMMQQAAIALSGAAFTIEEFLANEFKAGMIDRNLFTTAEKKVLIHGHCYQKSLSSQDYTTTCLEIPVNYKASLIPSGCCGMAGAFGYEKEHFDVSQQVGELVLFPAVRSASTETLIAAAGTSCRHQVKDGTGRLSQHPVEILYDALREARS